MAGAGARQNLSHLAKDRVSPPLLAKPEFVTGVTEKKEDVVKDVQQEPEAEGSAENETKLSETRVGRQYWGGPEPGAKAAPNQPELAARKSLDCFNFTGRQPVMTKIGSRDPVVKKMVYNQYRDMLRKYSNTSTAP